MLPIGSEGVFSTKTISLEKFLRKKRLVLSCVDNTKMYTAVHEVYGGLKHPKIEVFVTMWLNVMPSILSS